MAPASRNSSTSANSIRLPIREDSEAKAIADSEASVAINPPNSSATAPSHASTTGSHSFKRCISATDSRPAMVDAEVASKIGKNTSVGSAAPCCARYMKMDTGSKVNDDAFKTRNKICALLAMAGSGFNSCKARIAFRPMGVAALSSPSTLAVKFSVMRPSAGCPAGTSGISRRNNGDSKRASNSTKPAFSAMRKKPSHNVSVPNSSTITSTESRAMTNRLSTIA